MNDMYACLPGHSSQQADAEQAYVQAELKGNTTWVSIPPEAWPDEWTNKGWIRPVVILKYALYGHPDSGTFWEKHCDERLRKGGFRPLSGWPSCYFHDDLKLFLTVYVDDFKLAALKEHVSPLWKDLRQLIRMGDPEPPARYLGCELSQFNATVGNFEGLMRLRPKFVST